MIKAKSSSSKEVALTGFAEVIGVMMPFDMAGEINKVEYPSMIEDLREEEALWKLAMRPSMSPPKYSWVDDKSGVMIAALAGPSTEDVPCI